MKNLSYVFLLLLSITGCDPLTPFGSVEPNSAPTELQITVPTEKNISIAVSSPLAVRSFTATAKDPGEMAHGYIWEVFVLADSSRKEIYQDNPVLLRDGESSSSQEIDFSGYEPGRYLVRVSVLDPAGNRAKAKAVAADERIVTVSS